MKSHISPATLALIAFLSIGGLLFLGLEAHIVGNVSAAPYVACCSVQVWQHAPTGISQGVTETNDVVCMAGDDPKRCCVATASKRTLAPIRLVGAKVGQCNDLPEKNYPIWVK